MPFYEFYCTDCHSTSRVYASITDGPTAPVECLCGGRFRRVYDVSFGKPMASEIEPHFNRSVGKVVSSMGEMRSELARKSDEMTERMGQPVNLQPLDPREVRAHPEDFGVKDAEGTKRRKELGRR